MTRRGEALRLFAAEAFAAPMRPRCLRAFERRDGIDYLLLDPAAGGHMFRAAGWYYGYPACCVEEFISGPSTSQQHPASGHLLCSACAAGPLAPLRPRPARRYGLAEWYEDAAELRFTPPHDHHCASSPGPRARVSTSFADGPGTRMAARGSFKGELMGA